jgi:hypothetical protein
VVVVVGGGGAAVVVVVVVVVGGGAAVVVVAVVVGGGGDVAGGGVVVVTLGAGSPSLLSTSERSSIVTVPVVCKPIPTERLVMPSGIAGVVQLACAQESELGSRGDCAHHA